MSSLRPTSARSVPASLPKPSIDRFDFSKMHLLEVQGDLALGKSSIIQLGGALTHTEAALIVSAPKMTPPWYAQVIRPNPQGPDPVVAEGPMTTKHKLQLKVAVAEHLKKPSHPAEEKQLLQALLERLG